jgi:hypothetical protein
MPQPARDNLKLLIIKRIEGFFDSIQTGYPTNSEDFYNHDYVAVVAEPPVSDHLYHDTPGRIIIISDDSAIQDHLASGRKERQEWEVIISMLQRFHGERQRNVWEMKQAGDSDDENETHVRTVLEADGQKVVGDNIQFNVPTGVVLDSGGDPVPGASVTNWRVADIRPLHVDLKDNGMWSGVELRTIVQFTFIATRP